MSFFFLLKNDLLPTKERQFRLRKAPDPHCVSGEEDGHTHILTCTTNSPVCGPLLLHLRSHMPALTTLQAVCLDWEPVEGTALELPLLWITVTCLIYVWDRRKTGKQVQYTTCRAELFGKLTLLKKTKFHNISTILSEQLDSAFPPGPGPPHTTPH